MDRVTDILTADEAAEVLLVCKGTVYQLLRSGELKGFKIGNNWKISMEAVAQYIMNKSFEENQ